MPEEEASLLYRCLEQVRPIERPNRGRVRGLQRLKIGENKVQVVKLFR
jgi:hypothetical protein